jgi:integrase
MAKRNNEPTKAGLVALAGDLAPGQRVRVGDGIYMTVDGAGRQRFQWRARMGGRGTRQAGGTESTFVDATNARDRFLGRKTDGVLRRLEKGRKMTLDQYVAQLWWPDVLEQTEGATQLDYRSFWNRDLKPYWKGVTFQELLDRDDFKDYIAHLRKTKKHTRGVRKGQPSYAAIERALDVFFRILEHAVAEGYLPYNPFERDNKKRRKAKRILKGKSERTARQVDEESVEGRAIRADQVPSALHIERVRLHMPGRSMLELAERRALISLIGWQGLRCGETLGLIWADCRDAFGPLAHLSVHRALKDIAGHLVLGPTKNKAKRTPQLWLPLVDELDLLWHAQGCPPLEQHIFRNRDGGFYRWDNFRVRTFYNALKRAGIIDKAEPFAIGAFDPKDFRHTAATLHLHATKPEADGLRPVPFGHDEIADRMGHTIGVFHSTYVKILRDDLQGAGGQPFDEIIRRTRRAVWGPLPGDADFENVELSAVEAAELTGLTVSALSARLLRGALPARKERGKYVIAKHDLVLLGLLAPSVS